ncbi:MAG: mechanosensitive ion channel protein MscS, partial [Legionella sp.]
MLQLTRQNNLLSYNTRISRWYLFFIFFLLVFCWSFASAESLSKPPTVPVSIKKTANFNEYLVQEKTHLITSINEIKLQLVPKDEKEYHFKTEQVTSILKMIQVKIESLEGFRDQQKFEQNDLNQRLKHLQQLPIAKAGLTIQERVATVEALRTANKQNTQLILDSIALAKEFKIALDEEAQRLQSWYENFVLEQKLLKIKFMKEKLNQDLSKLYQNNIPRTISKQKKVVNIITSNADYEANLLINNQNIAAIQYHLSGLNVQKMVIKADIIYLKNPDTKNLQLVTEIYKDALSQYQKIEKSMQQ